MNRNKGSGVVSLIIMVAVIWFFTSLFNDEDEVDVYNQPSSMFNSKEDCIEPENPYNYGTGHYAGYEWGENGNYCSGNSSSFIEGCEEYESQEEAFSACISS